jgi:hypothetical protein
MSSSNWHLPGWNRQMMVEPPKACKGLSIIHREMKTAHKVAHFAASLDILAFFDGLRNRSDQHGSDTDVKDAPKGRAVELDDFPLVVAVDLITCSVSRAWAP